MQSVCSRLYLPCAIRFWSRLCGRCAKKFANSYLHNRDLLESEVLPVRALITS